MADKEDENEPPAERTMCALDCGLYGQAETMNLCSFCYHTVVLSRFDAATISPRVKQGSVVETGTDGGRPNREAIDPWMKIDGGRPPSPHREAVDPDGGRPPSPHREAVDPDRGRPPSPNHEGISNAANQPPSSKDVPEVSKRCFTCKKRVGLMGFKCRCTTNVFCSLHRHHDQHKCTFDYRAAAQDAILKANPVVKAEKMDKI